MDRRRLLLAFAGGAGAALVVPHLSVREPGDGRIGATVPDGVDDVELSRTWNPPAFTEGIAITGSRSSVTVDGGMWDGNDCSRRLSLASMGEDDGTLELLVASVDAQEGVCDAEGAPVSYTVGVAFDDPPDSVVARQRNHVGRTWETRFQVPAASPAAER